MKCAHGFFKFQCCHVIHNVFLLAPNPSSSSSSSSPSFSPTPHTHKRTYNPGSGKQQHRIRRRRTPSLSLRVLHVPFFSVADLLSKIITRNIVLLSIFHATSAYFYRINVMHLLRQNSRVKMIHVIYVDA